MSEKVSIKALLEGVEVEWKPLGNVAEYEQPTKYLVKTKNYSDKFTTPVLTAGKTFILGYTDEANGIYKASETPVIIFDDFTTANKWVDFDFKAKSSAMKMITSKDESEVLLKYIYYWLNTLPSDLIDGDHKRQWISNFSNKFIPVPSLTVQSEIVRILDNFTELTVELTVELTARKKQYQFYRDRLLTFEDGEVEFKRLGEVAKIKNGKDWKKIGQGNIPVYGSGGIMGSVDTPIYSKVSVLIPRKGTITNIFYTEEPFWNVDTIFYTIINEEVIIPKYFYYFMSNYNLSSLSTDSTRPSLTQTILNKILIPIPPLQVQQKIVSILDKFDTLTSSISEGLPHEIELRQKQYEYYRDLLLTFPKNDVKAQV